ncbi:MAG: MerR family transcriptional regulator [Alphaproteobacteria bacterium]|nr:MerR family transcriptional regulator [Alphaproteobacteria bacterium]
MAVAKKSADAFRTISEAAEEVEVPQHVLRHWEDTFGQIRPMRRAGGRRYYRPMDLDLLRGVRVLLYDERYTTKGVQKIFKENGAKYIAEIGRMAAAGKPIDLRTSLGEDDALRAADAGASTGELRDRLTALLARLEAAQRALDDATAALDAVAPEA